MSAASAVSARVFPCGSALECNPLLQPIVAAIGALAAAGLLAIFVMFYRRRPRGYVVAVVDVTHSANLGSGSRFGIDVVRDAETRNVTGIAPSKAPKPDIRVRRLRGGRFEVTDRTGRHVAESGEPIVAIDARGGRHQLILHAFDR